jgi:hypothetical protein
VIEDGVDAMRQGIATRHPLRNPSLVVKWPADIDALFRALFYDRHPDAQKDVDRLRRIADQLGIEYSPRRREPTVLDNRELDHIADAQSSYQG